MTSQRQLRKIKCINVDELTFLQLKQLRFRWQQKSGSKHSLSAVIKHLLNNYPAENY